MRSAVGIVLLPYCPLIFIWSDVKSEVQECFSLLTVLQFFIHGVLNYELSTDNVAFQFLLSRINLEKILTLKSKEASKIFYAKPVTAC